jgi:hypothetical protein
VTAGILIPVRFVHAMDHVDASVRQLEEIARRLEGEALQFTT